MPDKRATGEFYYERQVEEAEIVTGMYSLAASIGKKVIVTVVILYVHYMYLKI